MLVLHNAVRKTQEVLARVSDISLGLFFPRSRNFENGCNYFVRVQWRNIN